MAATLAFQQICDFHDEYELEYETSPEEGLLEFSNYRTEGGNYRGYWRVKEGSIAIEVFAPIQAPEGSIQDISEAVCRVNCGLNIGRFAIDCDVGTIGFRATSLFECSPDEPVVRIMGQIAFTMMETFMSAYLSIIFANEEPKVAIHQAWENLKAE